VEVGSPAAEETLQQIRARVSQSVHRVCPAWLAAERDDIVQVAMIKIARTLAGREGKAPLPSSYIWKVAYSATVDEIRRRRRMREVPLDEATDHAASAPGHDPDRQTETHRIAEGVVDCLKRLAEARRLAVTLFLQGHTVPEASRLLGWSVKKVENLVFRGLADLRACLTGKGLQP
jgi:RNA polymerase sigma-70 factor (ECF subfamily)